MLPKSATLKDLQKECIAQGLDPKGKKVDLVDCLQDNASFGASSAEEENESETDAGCEAVLVARSEPGDEEQTKRNARAMLEKAAVEEEFYVEYVKGEFFVAKHRGLCYARDKMDKRDFGTRILALEEDQAQKDIKINSLEDRANSLTPSLDAYKLLRNRFLSTFKRDKLPTRPTLTGGSPKQGTYGPTEAMLLQAPYSIRA